LSSQICHGGEVPNEYYKKYDIDVDNFTSVSVGRGSTLQIDYNVKVIDSVIR